MAGDNDKPPNEARLSVLTKARGHVRTKITNLASKVNINIDIWTENEVNMHLLKAKTLHDEITRMDDEIMTICIQLDKDDDDLSSRSISDENYTDALLTVIAKLENPPTPRASNTPNINQPFILPQKNAAPMKLPPIELPKFGNDKGENLAKFLKIFDAILDKQPDLSEHQQFLLLQGQLSGPPRILVETLDFDLHTYSKAKEALQLAFDSADKSKDDIITMLSNLKMKEGEEPYNYIGNIRTIISSVNSLAITPDDFIRHFVWKGFNADFQSHMTNITTKFMPSLDEINNNLFHAADRYNKQMEAGKSSNYARSAPKGAYDSGKSRPTPGGKETSANAMNVSNKSKIFCNLCKSDGKACDHLMSKCPVYTTGRAKFDKLKKIKGCVKCSFCNHESSQCRFVFKSKCRFCDGDHYGFLCLKGGKNENRTAANATDLTNSEENNSGMTCTATYQTHATSSLILPTFTAQLEIGKNNYVPIRVFKDGGSQTSFLSSSISDMYSLPIVKDNVPLVIRGFNSSKRLNTKIVKMKLKFGSSIFSHDVICVDDIRTRFKIDGMGEIISEFTEKGYDIADSEYITNNSGLVDNIDLVLGTDTDHMLSMQYRTFGDTPNTSASFIETPIGIVFSGSVRKMKDNLKFLPRQGHEITMNFIETSYPYILTDNTSIPSVLEPDLESTIMFADAKHPCAIEFSRKSTDNDTIFSHDKSDVISNMDNFDLIENCKEALDICSDTDDADETKTNLQLTDYALKNTTFTPNGNLQMPLLWNNKCSHLLAKNYNLARKLLKSNFDKLRKDPEKLKMYDSVFREQEELGFIERINNLDDFLMDHPEASFLCHFGVFKLDRESTKCRVVFMSNLCEKFNGGISHNNAMLPGPNLNSRISTAILLNRFNKFLLTFDIKKAFCAIKLLDHDASRLCFLWYRSVEKNDYTIVGYRSVSLPFGLRNSPAILMLGLYKILVLDSSGNEKLDQMKKEIWNCIYMDNASYSYNSEKGLRDAYVPIKQIFEPRKMYLQQFYTNSMDLQSEIDAENSIETPIEVKFFGMIWNRESDYISPRPIHLDNTANTKRKVLSSLNSIYDIFNLYAPMLLRARLFLQKLLIGPTNNWDEEFSPEIQSDWSSICKQVNGIPSIGIPRFVGDRDASYSIIGMSDSSKDAYGVVLYLKNLNTNQVSYLTAKNRLVNTNAAKKTIPSLEFLALAFGVQCIYEVYQELSGNSVVIPIKIEACHLFVDSMICIHWLIKYSILFEKLQSLSVFVKNKLRYVNEVCAKIPITFRHIAGVQNTSDYLTRPTTYRVLSKSCYYTGPDLLKSNFEDSVGDMVVKLPNPLCSTGDEVHQNCDALQVSVDQIPPPGELDARDHCQALVKIENYSSLKFVEGVVSRVFLYIAQLKRKIDMKKSATPTPKVSLLTCYRKARYYLISSEQKVVYRDIFSYLESDSKHLKEIPTLMNKYNVYRDSQGVLRVQSKLERNETSNLILLPKNSHLTSLLIRFIHVSLGHGGLFSVIRELRKNFWVERCMSSVKLSLKSCIECRRIHERPVRINQNSYRKFRSDPPRRCFQSISVDHIGPFTVKLNNERTKIWILIVTCLFSRAINLKICRDLTAKEFLRAIQLHCHEFAMFEECLSDQGSSIQAGAHTIKALLTDFETQEFLGANGIREICFNHYAKGNSSLGSVVESLVKQTKFLIQKSIKSNVLDYFDFEFLISSAVSLINKRPVGFKQKLCSLSPDEVPTSITPEMLLRGFDCPTVNLIPNLQSTDDDYSPDSESSINSEYEKLCKVRNNLIDVYHGEFLVNLIQQAVDKPDRYKPVHHKHIGIGDIVLLVDKHLKQYKYPMGRVISVETNSLGETTSARVRKGISQEVVYRHVTSLILLIPSEQNDLTTPQVGHSTESVPDVSLPYRPPSNRLAAKRARERIKDIE